MQPIHWVLIGADLLTFIGLIGVLVVLKGAIREADIQNAPLFRVAKYQHPNDSSEHSHKPNSTEPQQEDAPLLKRS